jgi:hypothetical protein
VKAALKDSKGYIFGHTEVDWQNSLQMHKNQVCQKRADVFKRCVKRSQLSKGQSSK